MAKQEAKIPDKGQDKVPDIPEPKELPQPRFVLISKIFDELDGVLAKHDEIEHLSIFEFEILVLMIRKKIEHLGIMAAMDIPHDHDEPKGNPDVYG